MVYGGVGGYKGALSCQEVRSCRCQEVQDSLRLGLSVNTGPTEAQPTEIVILYLVLDKLNYIFFTDLSVNIGLYEEPPQTPSLEESQNTFLSVYLIQALGSALLVKESSKYNDYRPRSPENSFIISHMQALHNPRLPRALLDS